MSELNKSLARSRSSSGGAMILIGVLLLASIPGAAASPKTDNPGGEVTFDEDDIIYAIMTDRFYDGDPTNNDQGAGEYRPDNLFFYQGGDWRGIIEKLDYIENLGVTTIMISPPMLNEWLNKPGDEASYHGYWAKDYYSTDPHFGTMDDLKELVKKAENRGIAVILDAVPNHTADFLEPGATSYDPRYGKPAPPFDNADWYHHEGSIIKDTTAYWDVYPQRVVCDLCGYRHPELGLDDLAQEKPEVEKALNDAYKFWIDETGAHGYRFDAVKHVPTEYISSFQNAVGVPTFGEAWYGTVEQVAPYQAYLWGMEDFPLYHAIEGVFAWGQGFWKISDVFWKDDQYRDPHRLITFIETHDTARFLHKSGSLDKTELALTFIFTVRGIPMLYYGTEQGMLGMEDPYNRGMMSSWDQDAYLYKWIQKLAQIRKDHAPLRRGTQEELYSRPDVYAFRRVYQDNEVVVVFNNSDGVKEATIGLPADSNLTEGTILTNLLDVTQKTMIEDQKLKLRLSAKKAQILVAMPQPSVSLFGIPPETESAFITVNGTLVDAKGDPIAGAKIEILVNEEKVAETTTASDGGYTEQITLEEGSNKIKVKAYWEGELVGLKSQVVVYSPPKGLPVLLLIGVIAGVSAIAFFVLRRR